MDYKIELYRGSGHTFVGTLPFMPVVQQSLERLLGRNLSGALIHITVLSVPEEAYTGGTPAVENLVPEFGYTYIKVYRDGQLLYQHPHTLSEVIVPPLQAALRQELPDETHWGFRVDIPGLPQRSFTRPTPQVQGEIVVQSFTAGDKPAFSIRRVAEEEPPERSLAEFAITADADQRVAPVKVLVPREPERELMVHTRFSHEVEEGGFLIGKVYRDMDRPGAHLVVVNEALPAKYTGASLLHFTFTGDSFIEAKRALQEGRPGERVVGWYHTHLFAATPDFGLSSIDLRLHFSTFTFPWQVAGLVNLDGARRVLRFYAQQGNDMHLIPHWVIDERP